MRLVWTGFRKEFCNRETVNEGGVMITRTRKTKLSLLILIAAGFALLSFFYAGPVAVQAADTSMKKADDSDLDAVAAQSFADFTLENDIASAQLNINADMYADVGAFQAHQDNGQWDQDWSALTIGTGEEDPFQLEGFILEAEFDDLDKDGRQLLRLTMGFESATGIMDGDFDSISGYDETGAFRRDQFGGHYEFDGDPFLMHIETEGPEGHPGIYMDFGGARRVDNND